MARRAGRAVAYTASVAMVSLIAAAFVLSVPSGGFAQNRVAPKSVNEEAFRDYLRRNLADNVKGYAFVIANRGGIVAKAAGGWAQAPGDGDLKMKTFIPSNAGSVMKVASAVAFLDLLEAKRPPGQSMDQALDVSIRHYVPDRWLRAYFKRGAHANKITLRDLLNHRSGLKEFGDGGAHGTKVARALAQGPNPSLIGSGDIDYLNENITLLLYMIPRLASPQGVDSLERAHEGKPLRDYNVAIAKSYGALYERYMREVFFKRVAPTIAPTCRPGEDYANNRYAKEYASKGDKKGDTDYADFCRSQGGWLFTAQELAHLARAIEFSNRLIHPKTRALFYDPQSPRQRLVFWRLQSSNILARDAGGGGMYRAHGGTSLLGGRAGLVRLPFGYVGVGLINSGDYESFEVIQFVIDAFAAATRNWTEWNTDRPGKNINNFLTDADPAICRARCERNRACKAWTYVKPGIQHRTRAKCWLKSSAPAARESGCCNSGVKGVDYGFDRPGADYLNFRPGRNDVALCQARCDLDSRCKAWTYVNPGFQGKRAKCYLKDRVPKRRKSDCCSSGVSR